MGKDTEDCCEACGHYASHATPPVLTGMATTPPLLAERGGVAITVHGRHGETRTVVPTGEVITIGRGKQCDIQIDDAALSRQQCRIRLDGGQVIVEDLRSSCGTWLDDAKLGDGGAAAREGSIVMFGNSRLVLHATRRR